MSAADDRQPDPMRNRSEAYSDFEDFGPAGGEVVIDDDAASDLKAAFDVPDRLPPMRLPPEHELAEAARNSELLARVRRLALWAGEHRPVLDAGELTAADTDAAARSLGMGLPDRTSGDDALPAMPQVPAARAMTDLPELVQLWELAEEVEFIEIDADGLATVGPSAQWR